MLLRYRGLLASGTFELTHRDQVVIGRSTECDIRTDDPSLSRKHARVEREGDGWAITDLASAHGMSVGGYRVERHILRVGETIKLGDMELVLEELPPSLSISVNDWQVAKLASQAITVGKSFAFVGPELMDQPSLRWLKAFVPASAFGHRILPLIGNAPLELPGVTIQPVKLPRLATAIVSSDKALYREGTDRVNLVVVDPLRGDGEVTLDVELDGARLTARPLSLTRGIATAALGDLPAGRYSIRVRGAASTATPCTFTVAAYKLSALVASMQRQRMEGESLTVDLKLTTFGTPVNGPVVLELMDEDERIGRFEVVAQDGLASAKLKLTGDGPHSINVQSVADPGKTATVPIIGSRTADRTDTVFSTLGAEVLGSLLASEDAQEIRGVWLRRGATSTSPVMLRQSGTTATLIALTAIERLTVVISDPTVPSAATDAVDARTAPHPISDYEYAEAEKLFLAGDIAKSLEIFAAARARRGRIHPNYAYYIACCHARLGAFDAARAALRTAFEDGWVELEHMRNDEDLASLRGDPLFQALLDGPRVVSTQLAADEVLELALPSPVALLAVGAYAGGSPWEGYAAVVVPSSLALAVDAPAKPTPGAPMTVTVTTPATAAYVIVKDARLASTDTPASMLASRLKAHASAAGKVLGRGRPTTKLADILPAPPPPPRPAPSMQYGGPPGMPGSAYPSAPAAGHIYSPSRGVMSPRPTEAMPNPTAAPMMYSVRPAPMMRGALPQGDAMDLELGSASRHLSLDDEEGLPGSAVAQPAGPARPVRTIDEAPEVVFAGVVEIAHGRGELTVSLPEAFAEYVIEAFAIGGTEWAASTQRVRAELEHFATIELPAFVHASDTASGRLTAGSGAQGMQITVTRDGAPIAVMLNGVAVASGSTLSGPRVEVSFLVGPGDYVATVTDIASGAAIATNRRVDVPGKLRRIARTIRFLRPREKIALADDGSLVTLRVLPGLDKPFKLMCDATADYGHACCEQTAAKILAACSMYLFAGDDKHRRDKAEEIILAGVRREHTMWLRGRGFKMYPDSGNDVNEYWGKKCARYLWDLDLLRAGMPSRALVEAIDDALTMARDTTAAYGMQFPPARSEAPADDYAMIRFQTDEGVRQAALARVRQWSANAAPRGGAVAERMDAAYAAAALLRGGGSTALSDALRLANRVVADIGPEGRLYSTCDSVAAIALMAELQAAKIIGGGGNARVDGQTMKIADAVAAGEVSEVDAIDGTVAVEVTRIVEDDWSRFSTAVPVTVLLTSGGRTTTRVKVGDALDLTVRLDDGYTPGDLVWVALPDALSRVIGGGQVKRFSVDPAGRREVTIPLAATGHTVDRNHAEAPQRFAVCVRNMFDEDRAGNPGYLDVTVRR